MKKRIIFVIGWIVFVVTMFFGVRECQGQAPTLTFHMDSDDVTLVGGDSVSAINDQSANNLDLTAAAGVRPTYISSTSGLINSSSIEFLTASTQYLTRAFNTNFYITEDYTWTMYVKLADWTPAVTNYFMGNYQGTSDRYWILVTGIGTLQYAVVEGGSQHANLQYDVSGLDVDEYHFIAIVGDSTNNIARVYIDGDTVAITRVSWDNTLDGTPASGFTIGAERTTGNNPATQSMRDFRLYKTALSAAQVDSVRMECINALYVDQTSGNDLGAGTYSSSPWKTLAKVNAQTFIPGTSVYLKKTETWRERLTVPSSGVADSVITFSSYGETWRERLTVPSSGVADSVITFSSYGTGAAPILDASVEYDTWTTLDDTVLNKVANTANIAIFNTSLRIWAGQGSWEADTTAVITGLEVNISAYAGTFSEYVIAEIWTLTGTTLNTLVSASDSVLITTPDSIGVRRFTGMSASIDSGTVYSLLIRRTDQSFDAANYLFLRYDNGGDSWSGSWAYHRADSTQAATPTYECDIRLFKKTYYSTQYVVAPKNIFSNESRLTKNAI
jgi:hypothetical protein